VRVRFSVHPTHLHPYGYLQQLLYSAPLKPKLGVKCQKKRHPTGDPNGSHIFGFVKAGPRYGPLSSTPQTSPAASCTLGALAPTVAPLAAPPPPLLLPHRAVGGPHIASEASRRTPCSLLQVCITVGQAPSSRPPPIWRTWSGSTA
jgi:hypothetical protein